MLDRSLALHHALAVAAVAALVAGCPTGSGVDPIADSDGGDAGGGVGVQEAGGPDSTTTDASDASTPPACGRLTTLCAVGEKCVGAPDCASKVCSGGVCKAVAPADGVKNGDETDVDCGGTMAPACADTKGCLVASDCTSGVCTGKICKAPTSTDGVQNGNETGIDCGGTSTGAGKCPAGMGCLSNADCANVKCDTVQKKCLPASHTDGLKNDGETGVDCGGTAPSKCPTGEGCVSTTDCNAVACDVGATNLCLAPTHTDGIKNLGETGTDCGGAAPLKCATGEGCVATSDCNNVACDVAGTKLCLPPSHTDGILNLGETGVDCGGAALPLACDVGQGCGVTADCKNTKCNPGTLVCDPPSKTDGIKNGTETDVDCGGGAPTNAGPCAGGKVCVANTDCTSTACNYAGKCAWARSCKNHMGGDTCGKGEVGQAGAAHEDCCTSVPLPDNSVRMDKYEITAGRMREFIAVTGGQVRQWVDAHRAETAQISDTMLQYLPEGNKSPTRSITQCNADGTNCVTTNQGFGVYDHLGLTTIMPDRPCAGCGQGCWIGSGNGQNGHNTYYWPPALNPEWGTVDRTFDQNTLDVKSLNCTPQLLFAAFCAWDGGRLPTWAELGGNSVNSAWGNQSYPWGTATPNDVIAGTPPALRQAYYPSNGHPDDAGYFFVKMPANYAAAAQYNTTNFNPNYHPSWPDVRYAWPNIATTGNDTAYLIAGPGRFWNDYREVGAAGEGFYDVGGNLLEATGDVAGTDNVSHNSWPTVRWVGGSFEGHPVGRANHNLSVLTKYGKQGARCVRPL
jgi:hypothetical protein